MITKKEIIEILENFNRDSHGHMVRMIFFDGSTYIGICRLDYDDVADQIISQLPKLEMFAEGNVEDMSCEYSGGFHVGEKDLDSLMWEYKDKNIKIYVEVIDANRNT